MRLIKDNCGNIIKEAETAEDYLLLEIERLKEENEELKQEILNLKNDGRKYLSFIIDASAKECDYLVEARKDGLWVIERGNKNE